MYNPKLRNLVARRTTAMHNPLMAHPGPNIRTLRRQKNVSLKALAKAVGMDHGNLSRLENGKGGFSHDLIERIAEFLGYDSSVLYKDPAIVEAAALRMRIVPVLTSKQLRHWAGPDTIDLPEDQPVLHADLRRTGRLTFGLVVSDKSNVPALEPGDDLIFEGNQQPVLWQIVVGQDPSDQLHVGRFRALTDGRDGELNFEIIPFNAGYPPVSTLTHPGLTLRGVLRERRQYFPLGS